MGKYAKVIKERSAAIEPKRVEVPELGDDSGPLIVFMHPLTLAQRSKITPLIAKDDLAFIAKTVVLSARDPDGRPIFDIEDEKAMVRSKEVGWIERLANVVADDLKPEGEELGEN